MNEWKMTDITKEENGRYRHGIMLINEKGETRDIWENTLSGKVRKKEETMECYYRHKKIVDKEMKKEYPWWKLIFKGLEQNSRIIERMKKEQDAFDLEDAE